MERLQFLRLRGEAEGENLCARQGQIADACPVARPLAESSGRGTGACAPLPRTVFHSLTREERNRAQREACTAAGGQECIPLLPGLCREGLLQPHHCGQHQPDGES